MASWEKNLFTFIVVCLSNIHCSSSHCLKILMNSLASNPPLYPRYNAKTVDSAGGQYPFRDESAPLIELTARIISKVFLLDGRQVLFHVSVNTSKPLGKPPRGKRTNICSSRPGKRGDERNFLRKEKSAAWGQVRAERKRELTFP